jgi:hypothetical protein
MNTFRTNVIEKKKFAIIIAPFLIRIYAISEICF